MQHLLMLKAHCRGDLYPGDRAIADTNSRQLLPILFTSIPLHKAIVMIRQMIVPAQNTYLLHLPDDLIGKNVEVIAFSTDDASISIMPEKKVNGRTIEEAIAFYTKHAVDISKLEKWNREYLYE